MTRKLVALAGEILLISGAFVAAFFVYEIWFTNLLADQRAVEISNRVERYFSEVELSPASQSSSEPALEKNVVALVYIPKLREDVWGIPVLSGVGEAELSSGLGHYPQTVNPGELGNFAVAGHRATNGEPFAYFEKLEAGDLVFVRTNAGYFTYRLFENQKIAENEIWVIDNKPQHLATVSEQLITLTTCDPRWNSTQRWAWWGEFVGFSKSAPEELEE